MKINDLPTREQAKVWAATAVEILWDAGDPFDGAVRRHELKREIELAVLQKLCTHDEPDLTEAEFAACVSRAKEDSSARPAAAGRAKPYAAHF